jgi:inositol-phosphate phosphatase/L-galactose 1-phosphate phosphatase/histidinol-phosphatase
VTTCLLCRYGEEGGLKMPEGGAKYTWVLDPIDGTKSFITGKPVFGTLIALVREGVPVRIIQLALAAIS